jgi:ATP-dependent exoDNAse (exonuclease V) beta subunit
VDYKTDRILPKEIENRALLRERMQTAHGTQLSCYSDAVEGLFGKKPDHVYLYLVSLGDVIEF